MNNSIIKFKGIHPVVNAAQNGDNKAMHDVLTELYPYIEKAAISRTKNNLHLLHDVVSNSMYRFFKYFKNFKGDSALSTWAYSMVSNEYLRVCKTSSKLSSRYVQGESIAAIENNNAQWYDVVAYDDNDPADSMIVEDVSKALTKAYGKIHKNAVDAFDMRLEGASMEDIAAATGTNKNTVKSRLYYARGAINEELAKVTDIRLSSGGSR